MIVWGVCVSISVTITDIWTKLGTEHKYHTINTPEWPNTHKLKIQDGGRCDLEFQSNVNNSDICTKFHRKMHHGHAEMTTWPKVETGNRFSWRHHMKFMCVDLSDYNRYLNQVWHRTQIPHYQHARMPKFILTKNPRWQRPPSWISEKRQ